jgi:hypothetical protein
MSLSLAEEIKIVSSELEKLAIFSIKIGLPREKIAELTRKFDKLELMILDAAMKGLDLVKQRETLLLLEGPYLELLNFVTVSLLRVLKSYIKS